MSIFTCNSLSFNRLPISPCSLKFSGKITNPSVRPATPQDFEKLKSLLLLWEQEDTIFRPGTFQNLIDSLPQVLETQRLQYLIAEDAKGQPIGCASISQLDEHPYYPEASPILVLANLFVHPDYRNEGTARKLATERLKLAQSKFPQTKVLATWTKNPAVVTLYQSLGFNINLAGSKEGYTMLMYNC